MYKKDGLRSDSMLSVKHIPTAMATGSFTSIASYFSRKIL